MKNIEKYISNCRLYCIDIENVENYDKVIAYPELNWVLHHRKEIENGHTVYTHKQLLLLKLYYHRPSNELIFLTSSEHKKLHMNTIEEKNKQRLSHVGKKHGPFTKEHSKNKSLAQTGRKNPAHLNSPWNKIYKMTIKEAAELLLLSISQVCSLHRRGKLKEEIKKRLN